MCTVTFFPKDDNNWLLSTNRDEIKSREKALPPKIHQANNLKYIAPVDGKAGGTWIGLNSAALCLTLINNYQGVNPLLNHREKAVSRGHIILGLMHLSYLTEVDISMKDLDVTQFNPFKLIGIQSNPCMIMEWSWDGQNYITNTLPVKPHLWVSTGRDYKGVWNNRRSIFENFLKHNPNPGIKDIKKLHSSTYPEPGAYSIAMEFDNVASVSNAIVEISRDNIIMYYFNDKPVEWGKWEVTGLPLMH